MVSERTEHVGPLHVRVVSPAGSPARASAVLVHGVCMAGVVWRNWAEALAKRGIEAWCVDLRGHGASDGREKVGSTRIDEYASDVESVVARSSAQVVMGHNMGGLAAQVAATRLTLRALVLVGTVAPKGIVGPSSVSLLWRELRPRYVRAMLRGRAWRPAEGDVRHTLCGLMPTELATEVTSWLQDESGTAVREMVMTGVAVEAEPGCPVLVVASTFDRLTPPARQRLIASRYRADYVEFAQHAHFPMLEPGWERPIAVIGRWLEEAARIGEHGRPSGRLSTRRTLAAEEATASPIPRVDASETPAPETAASLAGSGLVATGDRSSALPS